VFERILLEADDVILRKNYSRQAFSKFGNTSRVLLIHSFGSQNIAVKVESVESSFSEMGEIFRI